MIHFVKRGFIYFVHFKETLVLFLSLTNSLYREVYISKQNTNFEEQPHIHSKVYKKNTN